MAGNASRTSPVFPFLIDTIPTTDWISPSIGPDTFLFTSAGAGLVINPGAISTLQYTVPLASLGVGPGSTIYLEAVSTGGGSYDSAIDTVNAPSNDWNAVNWQDQASIMNSSPYTITPEPASLALLVLGGLALIRRR